MSIKDVAEETGLSAHAIRYYEKEGLVTIPRDKNGIRIFDDESKEALKSIAHYRNVGMSLDDIRHVMSEFTNHELSTELLKKTYKELELKLLELEAVKAYLEEKISIHTYLAQMQQQGYSPEERIAKYFELKKQGDN